MTSDDYRRLEALRDDLEYLAKNSCNGVNMKSPDAVEEENQRIANELSAILYEVWARSVSVPMPVSAFVADDPVAAEFYEYEHLEKAA